MSTLTIELPSSVPESDARLLLAIKLFEVGRLSCGQAAALAGFSKRTFIELLGKNGVSVIDHSSAEIMDDVKNA